MESITWKEFKVEDIFEVKLSAGDNKITNLPKGNIPLISAGSSNNGIVGYVASGDGNAQLFSSNTLTVDMFGKPFFQPNEYYAVSHGRLNILEPKVNMPKEALLYVVGALEHLTKIYSFSLMLTSKRLKEETLKLPATPSGEPDYDFMANHIKQIQANHIKQIQANHIKQIQAYIKVAGENNPYLNGGAPLPLSQKKHGEFRLGDLVTFKAIKQAKSQKDIPTDNTPAGVPYVVQSIQHNMVGRSVNKDWLISHNEAPVSGNKIALGVTLPAVSYQKYEFGASQIITAEAPWLNEYNGQYMASAISKLMYRFSYGSKPGLQIYKDMQVALPISDDGSPDFEYMEDYIKFVQAEYIRKLQAKYTATEEAYSSLV
jgi:hypothetical protein